MVGVSDTMAPVWTWTGYDAGKCHGSLPTDMNQLTVCTTGAPRTFWTVTGAATGAATATGALTTGAAYATGAAA